MQVLEHLSSIDEAAALSLLSGNILGIVHLTRSARNPSTFDNRSLARSLAIVRPLSHTLVVIAVIVPRLLCAHSPTSATGITLARDHISDTIYCTPTIAFRKPVD